MPPYCDVDIPPYWEVDMPPYWDVDRPPPCAVLKLRGHSLMFGISPLSKIRSSHWLGAQRFVEVPRLKARCTLFIAPLRRRYSSFVASGALYPSFADSVTVTHLIQQRANLCSSAASDVGFGAIASPAATESIQVMPDGDRGTNPSVVNRCSCITSTEARGKYYERG